MKLKKKNKLVLFLLLPYLLLFIVAIVKITHYPTDENRVVLSISIVAISLVIVLLSKILFASRKGEKHDV